MYARAFAPLEHVFDMLNEFNRFVIAIAQAASWALCWMRPNEQARTGLRRVAAIRIILIFTRRGRGNDERDSTKQL